MITLRTVARAIVDDVSPSSDGALRSGRDASVNGTLIADLRAALTDQSYDAQFIDEIVETVTFTDGLAVMSRESLRTLLRIVAGFKE